MQELIWRVRPDVIVECGVAHGGALVLYASILELLGKGGVVGVDVEIRKYNRSGHREPPAQPSDRPDRGRLGRPTTRSPRSVAHPSRRPRDGRAGLEPHRAHVAAELERYAPLVTPGSYFVVFDSVMTMVSDAPNGKPEWDQDNPLEAVRDFLETTDDFDIDPD